MNNDYREIIADMIDIEDYLNHIEEELETELMSDWRMIDKTSTYAVFTNYRGENRIVSAKQINNAFKHEDK